MQTGRHVSTSGALFAKDTCPLIFLPTYVNLKALLRLEDRGVRERLVADLVEGVRGVGDELAEEDFLVGVERVDDEAHQLGDFRLEHKGLDFVVGHGAGRKVAETGKVGLLLVGLRSLWEKGRAGKEKSELSKRTRVSLSETAHTCPLRFLSSLPPLLSWKRKDVPKSH